jgi:hypothetical protein
VLAAALVAGFVVPAAPAAAAPTTVVAFGASDWAYYRATSAPPTTWRTTVQKWAKGTAPFGFGHSTGTLATRLPNAMRTKPLASYFQRTFWLGTVPAAGLTVTTWADDGVLIYVNGKEVLRSNVDKGAPKHDGYWASNAPQSSRARAKLVSVTIPASVLKVGTNLLAAQVQSNWRATHNVTFDARLAAATPIAKPAPTQPPTPTTPPTPTAPPTTSPLPAPTPATPTTPGYVPSPASADKWGQPTWRDEFDYLDPATGKPAMNPANWNVRSRSEMGLFVDAAVVDPGQVTVDADGVAHLRADWLQTPISRPHETWPDLVTHKTGYIDQRSMQQGDVVRTQRWGRWEMRAQVPVGPQTYGALPAFWLRNAKSGEIDIMEAWGYNEQPAPGGQRIGTSTTTIHNDTMHKIPGRLIQHHTDPGAAPIHAGFHTWAFELMPTYAAVYLDEKQVLSVTPATYPDLWNEQYFGAPFHMRINLHVGISEKYWGRPDPNNPQWTQNVDYKIDYVRTWAYTPG